MAEIDHYATQLDEAAALLTSTASITAVRGNGNCRFVYAEKDSRAIELAKSGNEWWVEFWANEQASAERTYASFNDAVVAAMCWLAQNVA